MKFSITAALLFALVAGPASAAVIQKRDDVAIVAGPITEPTVVTATRVFPTLIDEPPFMKTVTSEVVWTQYPAAYTA
ncbi:hypothetical protein D9758_014540 [Tetrapyrgos nigripes]|uniref:ABC transporter substrate-binding protein n=1 Tax=Tetrapyrgos nigripes TaxID=182062 RepID=A0A8H5CG75_9AGAR|nr:hypothetical protein D9758_014540 [Tetrapyrgos nigripes]